MVKTYLLKFILLFVLLNLLLTKASAQYAIGGSAGTNLTHSVYWLTWDNSTPGSALISKPAGSSFYNVTAGTYVWQFSPTVRITAIISNLTSPDNGTVQVYTPGDYPSDGLDLIYSGNNLPKPNSRGVANSALATSYGSTITFDIDIKVAILINNVWTNVAYPGMVIGDAESIDSGGEFISGNTPNPIAWQLLNKRTQGQAEDSHYKMTLSNSGKSFKLFADLAPGNFGVQAVMFAHGASNLTGLSMKGSGITAMAIGFVLPFDEGDAPTSYGSPGSYIDQFKITDIYGGDGTFPVVTYDTTALVPQATVYIGANNVDPDGQPNPGTLANADDDTGNDDENTLTPSALPDLKVNQAGDYSLTVPVTNTKSVPATLRGWIDFNGDGIFSTGEEVEVTVPANTSNKNFTLTFPNSLFSGKIKAGLLYARLRITTTNLIDDPATAIDERSTSFAADGEVEDYKLKDVLGVNIAGSIFDDGNGGSDGAIAGTALQTLSGTPLYAYLVDNTNTIVGTSVVAADGTYSFANANNGTYTVAVAANNVAVGGSLSAVSANLPAGWVPSGAAYGTNNKAGTGIQTGTPNLQIMVNTPGTSLDVKNVNFGINKAPVAAAVSGSTTTNTPITVNPITNDSDADGTLNLTSVLLVDPADNVKKTSVTIPGNGTYTVNKTTGQVTFAPLPTFSGQATPVAYTVKDNFGTESAPALISINVVASAPAGVADVATTPVNTPVTTDVKANDGTSAAGAIVVAANGAHGTTAVNAAGQVIYTPNSGYIGTDTYTYTLTNNGLTSAPIPVTVTVTPVGTTDVVTTPVNTPVTTTVTANDGPSGVGATVTPTNGMHGTTKVDANGNVTYTPANGYIGTDTYTYTLTNNGLTSPPVTVNVTVVPVGVDDAATTPVNVPVTTIVTANDGPSATGATIASTNGTHGTTTVDADGHITYTPVNGYIGTDKYTYTLTKNGITSAPINVTVVITPAGVNDTATTPINTPVTMTVTANDGPSAIGATVTATNGSNGTTAVNSLGQVIYTPANGFVGTDTYTYTLTTNGVTSSPITGTVLVTPFGVADATSTPENTPVTTTVTANDGPSASGATVVPTNGSHGTTTVNSSGQVTYTPANGFTGTDTYTYTLTNNGVTSDPIPVTVNVYASSIRLTKAGVVSGTAKVGSNITYTLVVTNTGTTTLSNVAVTDPGVDAGTITPATISSITPGSSATVTATHSITQADLTKGSYSNQASASGKDQYGNTVTKAKSDDPATAAVDDPTVVPLPTPGSVSIVKTGVFSSNYITYTFVVTNTGSTVLNPVNFTDLKLNLSDSVISVAAGLQPGASINFKLKYTLTQADKDAGTVSNTALVDATDPAGNTTSGFSTSVVSVPKSPVALDDEATTYVGEPVKISILNNDNPGSSTLDPSSIEIISLPTHGTISLNPDGTTTYTPNAGYVGTDAYTYRVKDKYGYYTNVANVVITINARPQFKIPTLFTPNGDGVNDTFVIIGLDQYQQNKLVIVNRWGNEVYNQTNYQNDWAGTGLNEGTYYYLLQVKNNADTEWKTFKGYTTLLRNFKKN